VAEITELVPAATGTEATRKVTAVAPLGTVTVDGTDAAPTLLLARATCTPGAGTAPFIVRVAVDGLPPITLVGDSFSEDTVRAWIDRTADFVTVPNEAEMVALVAAETG